ncbi:putative LRR receptor-like serine/threonine-protein kinase At1g53440 [Curcuma longa]|uniref:putative LRR receptor-like serine/threonine-protein kinase At1g53440 n=1 Tax=Curcuma longa TaxID=136217 RepID=UPI003D9F8E9D
MMKQRSFTFFSCGCCSSDFNLIILSLLLFLSLIQEHGCQAQQLDPGEVRALRVIASKLKKEWNFSVDPCSGSAGWVEPSTSKHIVNNLTCNYCNSSTSVCHVTSIQLKGQNLTGVLPDEFANLTSLQVLPTRNYLNGTIPSAWASLPLTKLSLPGNRVSGTIPEELGSITTLIELTLDSNQLQGPIPASLGNLINLNLLHLPANNLTGPLPDSLGKLTNLTEFIIDGNPISGKIPSFIGNWTKLTRLDMQGTLMEGPFPPTFSNLTSITQLRVSDLKGGLESFPELQNMNQIQRLVLRNLSMTGNLPDFIAETPIKTLDVSFNNLSGPIPDSYQALIASINYMYLTSNMITGKIPDWILESDKNLDLSYNHFSGLPPTSSCRQGNVNLFASYSSTRNTLVAPCFRRNHPCTDKARNCNLFINCGGNEVVVDGNVYEADITRLGPSYFDDYGKWAYSSTGDFVDNRDEKYIATSTNSSSLYMDNSSLYMTARLSPLSLKYYGLCLHEGNYTVKLHFAEIMFPDDQTFPSVGQRIFDVSIQGQKVLRDYNIAKEANGTGKEKIEVFNDTYVNIDGTLEIHLQWGGKGTHAVPHASVYGPLISAISITPNFSPDLCIEASQHKLTTGAIVGIAAAVCTVASLIVLLILLWSRRRKHDNELRGLELVTGYFSFKQIKAATKNFDISNKLGEGGFGPVYKGKLPDGTLIAVKKLSAKSKQGNREFVNEIGMISALEHPNLVKLYGCCIEGDQLLLIYEYMENNSLARALFGPEQVRLSLDWQTRCSICIGIARGLAYLHEESRLKIVHRDIKATNILLDKKFNAKISDFGLAKLDEEENSHISTRIAGTRGYMAPEYALRGYLTDKADVYSFGVVMLETVSGICNTNYWQKKDFTFLLDWAYVLLEQDKLLELVDPALGSEFSKEEALQMLNLALACTNPTPTRRPIMSNVVSILEHKATMESLFVAWEPHNSMDFRSLVVPGNSPSRSQASVEIVITEESSLLSVASVHCTNK